MKGTDNENERGREAVLEELFRHATVRERPPLEAEQAVRESLREDWLRVANRNKRRRYVLAAAAAASVAVAFLLIGPLVPGLDSGASGVRVAVVERTKGAAYLHDAGENGPVELGASAVLETGQVVSAANGAGLAVRWQNGIALRIDQNSRVRLATPGNILVEAGRVYVDTSGRVVSEPAFEVTTPVGPVRHLGTRYMVAVILGTTSVSVREGQVLLVESGLTAAAGEKLVTRPDGGPRRETVAVHGDAWAWADELAEPVPTGGRSVAELLSWAGRETARRVRYDSLEAERLAQETRLVGDITVEPMQVLALVSQSTDLVAEVVAGDIVVRLDTAP